MGQILRAHSCATDAVEAVKELQFQFASHASGLIIFFAPVTTICLLLPPVLTPCFPE